MHTCNALHSRQVYVIKQLRRKLQTRNGIVAPADKSKTVVITYNNTYQSKMNNIPITNHFLVLHKDPTNKY